MYLALYRKYRPRTFDDVISQEHITTTLRNQVMSGSTGHAYLFTGSRGTGKTTCAKILAMAVNCLDPKNGSPCLECERCREILSGQATDIVEMDAASNNKVDDVRAICDEVDYTPVSCRFRVYIIDEVHNLSSAAFNALLKTLEEPPAHVKFILATTELQKVPATIISRCQRFEFRRVDAAESARRLIDVAKKENVTLEEDAAELIARLSDGGMRDALSILDRCAAAEGRITAAVVRECAGVADKRHLFEFSEMTAAGDAAGCLRLLGELHKGAKDISILIDELSGHYRDLMLIKSAPDAEDLLSALPDERAELKRIAALYTLPEILRCITLLQQCADGISRVKQRKTLAEMCFVKMCTGYTDSGADADGYGSSARKAASFTAKAVEIKPLPEIPFVPDAPKVPTTPAEKAKAEKTRSMLESVRRTAQATGAAGTAGSAGSANSTAATETTGATGTASAVNSAGTAGHSDGFSEPPPFDGPPPFDEPPAFDELPFDDGYPLPSGVGFPEPPDANAPVPEKADGAVKAADTDRAAVVEKTGAAVIAEKTDKADEIPVKEKADEAGSEAPEGQEKDGDGALPKLEEITEEKWKGALPKMGVVMARLLADSGVRMESGKLVITSENPLLLANLKGEELAVFEKNLSQALGASVQVIIEEKPAAPREKTPVEEFISKAQELGVDIEYKE